MLLLGCNNTNKLIREGEFMRWENPIPYGINIEDGKGFRDPYILRVDDYYYLSGTMYPHFEGDKGQVMRTKGVPLYKSKNLLDWEYVGIILERPNPKDNKWYQNYFWAPEIFASNGKFYLTVSCSTKGHYEEGVGILGQQAVLLAVSNEIEGPYHVLNEDEPLVYGNDAHLFKDTDGKVYLFVSGIGACEIDLNKGKLRGNIKQVVSPIENSDAWNAKRPGVGFEGPYVIKRNNTYYMFYSTWARGYEIGIAESKEKNPLRRWILNEKAFYGAMNEGHCNHYQATYEEGYYEHDYREAGHNSIFLGPDGQDWIVCHVFEKEDLDKDIKMVIDRLYYENDSFYVLNQNGDRVNGPTYGKQELKLEIRVPKAIKALDTYIWLNLNEEYALNQKMDILLDNGWRVCAPVVWEQAPDTSQRGSFEIKGSVSYLGHVYTCTLFIKVS